MEYEGIILPNKTENELNFHIKYLQQCKIDSVQLFFFISLLLSHLNRCAKKKNFLSSNSDKINKNKERNLHLIKTKMIFAK